MPRCTGEPARISCPPVVPSPCCTAIRRSQMPTCTSSCPRDRRSRCIRTPPRNAWSWSRASSKWPTRGRRPCGSCRAPMPMARPAGRMAAAASATCLASFSLPSRLRWTPCRPRRQADEAVFLRVGRRGRQALPPPGQTRRLRGRGGLCDHDRPYTCPGNGRPACASSTAPSMSALRTTRAFQSSGWSSTSARSRPGRRASSARVSSTA